MSSRFMQILTGCDYPELRARPPFLWSGAICWWPVLGHGVVEHAAFAEVVLAGDVDAGLLVQPPGRQPQVVSDSPGLFQDDSVRQEPGIDIAGDAGGVVGQGHDRAAHNEHICDDAPAG